MAARIKIKFFWVALVVSGCGAAGGEASIVLRFARQQQSQNQEDGLPDDLGSLKIEVRRNGTGGDLLDSSACIELKREDSRRSGFAVDLSAGKNLALVVKGWSAAGCPAAEPEWMGATAGVEIVAGRSVRVAVFVTRRGLRLNLARGEISPALAFASATMLQDGRLLLAGGFDAIESGADQASLTATNRAFFYYPDTGELAVAAGLSESRGAHRACLLSDGRVLLLGGAKKLVVRHRQGELFQIIGEEPLQTADLFDPASGQFQQAGQTEVLARLEAAAACAAGDNVYLLGGKTFLARSDDIVSGKKIAGLWQWSLAQQKMTVARRGAEAAVLGSWLLAVGGCSSGSAVAEAAQLADLLFQPVPGTEALSSLEIVGHSLTALSEQRAVSAGGISPVGFQPPYSGWLDISLVNESIKVTENALLGPRAYHAAGFSDAGLVLAGGVGAEFGLLRSVELAVPLRATARLSPDRLSCASLGLASAVLADGSLFLAGGLGRNNGGEFALCSAVELLSP